ncbi:hypothetical protein As57867_016726, partial [Aphanomyces stellatus]
TLGEGNPWLHSTLLADPVARHYGFRWLTDRIFHNALRAHAVVDPSVQDMMHINLHTNDDGWDMVGIENFSQTTVLAHFKDVANCMWDIFTATQITDVHLQQKVVQTNDMLYNRVYDRLHDTSVCVLLRRYTMPNRVVFTRLFLRDDECFPLQSHELRPHGFGWTIMEHIADDVTLYRSRLLHHVPVTVQGMIPLERSAQVFGVDATLPRPLLLERMQANALRNLKHARDHTQRNLHDRLTELERKNSAKV